MLDPITLQRLYTRPRSLRVEHLDALAPNSVVVEPVLPPNQTESGILLKEGDIPGTAAICFRVLDVGPETYPPPMSIGDGDIVVVRNAMLEPIHPAMDILVIEAKHILARLKLPEVPGGA
jgi:hypothetical protein